MNDLLINPKDFTTLFAEDTLFYTNNKKANRAVSPLKHKVDTAVAWFDKWWFSSMHTLFGVYYSPGITEKKIEAIQNKDIWTISGLFNYVTNQMIKNSTNLPSLQETIRNNKDVMFN